MTTALAVQPKTYSVYQRTGSSQQKPVNIVVDPEFESRIPPSGAAEHALLETSIREAGGIREKISVWNCDGALLLLDGHTRLDILAKLSVTDNEFKKIYADIRMYDTETISDRDAALLWIEENQLSRRNLTDDQRVAVWESIREGRSTIAKKERATAARKAQANTGLSAEITDKQNTPKRDTRKEVAKESGLPENKLRAMARLKKTNPKAATDVRAGKMTLRAAMKLEKTNPAAAAHFLNGEFELRDPGKGMAGKDNRKKYSEKDYFRRIGSYLANSLREKRLTELADMKKEDFTPEARQGLENLMENLLEVEKRARDLRSDFKKILEESKSWK